MTHPELKATFQLPIIGVKKNPSSPLYTSLGVITKGTVLEVSIPHRRQCISLRIFRLMLVNLVWLLRVEKLSGANMLK